MNTYGGHKVMFGADWPVTDPERPAQEMRNHGFREGAYAQIMRDNALNVFNFDRAGRRAGLRRAG